MEALEGDISLGRCELSASLHVMLAAIAWMQHQGDREVPRDTSMATVWVDVGHLSGVVHVCPFFDEVRKGWSPLSDVGWVMMDVQGLILSQWVYLSIVADGGMT